MELERPVEENDLMLVQPSSHNLYNAYWTKIPLSTPCALLFLAKSMYCIHSDRSPLNLLVARLKRWNIRRLMEYSEVPFLLSSTTMTSGWDSLFARSIDQTYLQPGPFFSFVALPSWVRIRCFAKSRFSLQCADSWHILDWSVSWQWIWFQSVKKEKVD